MMRRFVRNSVVALLLLPACSDSVAPRPPEPGTLTVTLTTPHTNDAAIVVSVLAPADTSVTDIVAAAGDVTVFHRRTGRTTRIALFGPLASGALLRFDVPDLNALSQYTIQVVEVADDANALRLSLSGYGVTLSR